MTTAAIARALLDLGEPIEIERLPAALAHVCADAASREAFLPAFEAEFQRVTGWRTDESEARIIGDEPVEITLQDLAGVVRPPPVLVGAV